MAAALAACGPRGFLTPFGSGADRPVSVESSQRFRDLSTRST